MKNRRNPGKIKYPVLGLALLVSFAAVVLLCVGRMAAERQNRTVSVVMAMEDVCLLADASGDSAADWLEVLAGAGAAAVITDTETAALSAQAADAGLSVAGPGGDWPVCFDPDRYAPGQILALVENESRTGSTLGRERETQLYEQGVPMSKCLYLYEDYAARYGMEELGYSGSEEVENLIYRAVTDRGIRILWLTPLTENGSLVARPEVYRDLIGRVEQRIRGQGLQMGPLPVGIRRNEPSRLLMTLCCLGVAAAAVPAVEMLVPLRRRWRYLLSALGALCAVAVGLADRVLTDKAMALAAAVLFPCLSVGLLARRLGEDRACPLGRDVPVSCLLALVPAVAGGLWVGAILSSTRYMLEVDQFSGVKLSQFVPLVFALAVLWKHLWHEPGRRLTDDIRARLESLKGHGKLKLIAAAVVLLAAVIIFLLRTGDGILRVSWLEQQMRNRLERTLWVRPRTKEMLIAWPALALALLCGRRRWRTLALPLGLLAAIGFCSVVNTFCHIRAELLQSLIRTLLGLGIGLVLGLLLSAAVAALAGKPAAGKKGGERA